LIQPLIQLNRVTFGKNVLEPSNNGVERWIVLFCLPWYEPCEALERPFSAVGSKWQDRVNTNLLSTEVRFATVDCSTDKVLCNEQMIYEFPKIVHFHKHAAVSSWSGGLRYTELVNGMRTWIGQQLGAFASRGGAEADEDDMVSFEGPESTVGSPDDFRLDVLVIVLAMLGNAWVVTRNPDISSTEKISRRKPNGRTLEQFITTSVSRFLPEQWSGERAVLEL